jgi:glucuronoarabinoxylan endo-1,4-beta-xylanase
VSSYPITATLNDPNSKLSNYTVTNTPGALTVSKAALSVTVNNQSMIYGSTLPSLSGVLTGVVTGDGITASYSTTATSNSPVSSYPITATLNDPNSKLSNYTVTNTPGALTVSKATPVITWTTPAAVTQGATLGAAQLDASANVPGSFLYTPAPGTALNTIGPVQLSTTFTPTDATDYRTTTDTVSLTVNSTPPGVTVDFGAQEQLIRGFGGSTAWLGQLTQAQANTLFSQIGNGLGLSILRVRIDPTGTAANNWVPTDKNWDQEAANGLAAVTANPNAIVFASPWSPPASMKINNSVAEMGFQSPCSPAANYCGGSLDETNFGAAYAQYLENFVTYFNTTNKFSLYAISMQNEPNFIPQGSTANPSYESCYWAAGATAGVADMDTWIKNYASTITSDPYSTKLIMPEADSFQTSQAAAALGDPTAQGLISIIGGHIYGVSPAPYSIPPVDSPKEIWMTEHATCESGCPAPSVADALGSAEEVHYSMTVGQFNAYVWWWIWNDPSDGITYGLINSSTTSPAPTYYGYGIGHFSKFVQPGYHRYAATAQPSANVLVSAYAGMDGTTQHYVIVAINSGTAAVSEPFTIDNATVTTLTPYETSSTTTGGLVPRSAITVSGNAFTYNLPALSITTFVQ